MPTQLELLQRPRAVADLRPAALPILEAARYLGVSRWTVQRLRRDGEVEGFRIGAAAMISTDSLDAYLDRQRARAVAERDGG